MHKYIPVMYDYAEIHGVRKSTYTAVISMYVTIDAPLIIAPSLFPPVVSGPEVAGGHGSGGVPGGLPETADKRRPLFGL